MHSISEIIMMPEKEPVVGDILQVFEQGSGPISCIRIDKPGRGARA